MVIVMVMPAPSRRVVVVAVRSAVVAIVTVIRPADPDAYAARSRVKLDLRQCWRGGQRDCGGRGETKQKFLHNGPPFLFSRVTASILSINVRVGTLVPRRATIARGDIRAIA